MRRLKGVAKSTLCHWVSHSENYTSVDFDDLKVIYLFQTCEICILKHSKSETSFVHLKKKINSKRKIAAVERKQNFHLHKVITSAITKHNYKCAFMHRLAHFLFNWHVFISFRLTFRLELRHIDIFNSKWVFVWNRQALILSVFIITIVMMIIIT